MLLVMVLRPSTVISLGPGPPHDQLAVNVTMLSSEIKVTVKVKNKTYKLEKETTKPKSNLEEKNKAT